MTTITIDEITRNAILAALDERAARLQSEITRLEPTYNGRRTEDAQRALVWNIAALHETNMARLQVAEAEAGGWEAWTNGERVSESELRFAAGDR